MSFNMRIEGRILTADEWLAMVRQETERRERSSRGDINVYVCDLCAKMTVTVDLDPGVTPFMMPCRNDAHLAPDELAEGLSARILKRVKIRSRAGIETDGTHSRIDLIRTPDGYPITGRSVAYRVPGFINADQAAFEFYRPSYDVYIQMKPGVLRDHVTNGGLLFRSTDGKSDLKNLE